jgi:hypothetical protein
VTDPAAPVEVGLAQVLGALARRRERRREAVAELGGAVIALAQAVERHTARVAELRRAIEARSADGAREAADGAAASR